MKFMWAVQYVRFFLAAGTGMSPSSSKDRIGACIRSYFVFAERIWVVSADRIGAFDWNEWIEYEIRKTNSNEKFSWN